jgi:1-acyl-sn-glycerol-3-phosphate acyltransferase
VLRTIGRFGMSFLRWDIEGEIPDVPRFVLVVAPHTSNWDFIVALLADLAIDMDAAWMGKHTIFRGPVGTWLRGLGGIPVERHAAHNVVAQMVDEFARRERLILAIAPEGTRKRVERWKSGYWHIARQVGVPILPVGLDFGRRRVVIGKVRWTTESHEHDEAGLKAFFATITPRHPPLA